MATQFQFDSFVCVGDVSTIELENGWTINARVEFDHGAGPMDFDCYSDEEINSWKKDEWFFFVELSLIRSTTE